MTPKNSLLSTPQTVLTVPHILTLRYTHTHYTPYTESFLPLVIALWQLPQPGCKLLERKRPPHFFPWNVQLTWSSLLLPNVFHPPPPITPLSYPSPLTINKVGLRASFPPSLRLLLVLYPGPTSLFWKFALRTRKHSKTSYCYKRRLKI